MENGPNAPLGISSKDVLDHLDALCQSQFFSSSKRSQEFLRYIVQEAIQGRAGQIKERNIACEVFGKDEGFEPGEHSVVRVKASDVRKRLVEYYKSAPPEKVRIELPIGSYAPHFIVAEHPPSPPSLPDIEKAEEKQKIEKKIDKPIERRRFIWMAAGALAGAGLTGGASQFLKRSSPPEHPTQLDLLWKPVFATKLPLIIYLPVMYDSNGQLTEWTGIGPAATLGLASEFLTRHHCAYQLRVGNELTYSQLRDSPSLLLGAFNQWVKEITSRLNLRYTAHSSSKPGELNFGERSFIDSQTNQTWETVKGSDGKYVTTDYGLVCRVFDAYTEQVMFLVFGLYTFGTEAAATLLFQPNLFSQLLRKAPAGWEFKNFQAIVRVSVVGTTISEPQIVAAHFW